MPQGKKLAAQFFFDKFELTWNAGTFVALKHSHILNTTMKCIFIVVICLLQSLRFDVAGNKPPVLKQFLQLYSGYDELQAIIVILWVWSSVFWIEELPMCVYIKCLYTFHEQIFFALKKAAMLFFMTSACILSGVSNACPSRLTV